MTKRAPGFNTKMYDVINLHNFTKGIHTHHNLTLSMPPSKMPVVMGRYTEDILNYFKGQL